MIEEMTKYEIRENITRNHVTGEKIITYNIWKIVYGFTVDEKCLEFGDASNEDKRFFTTKEKAEICLTNLRKE